MQSSLPLINPLLTRDWLTGNFTGKGVTVGIIDSGVDARHPDIRGKVKQACIVKVDDGGGVEFQELPGEESFDDFGHGTAVAGAVLGVAPDVKIVSIKVLNDYNSCTGDVLIQGMIWALRQNLRLVNMSLATANKTFYHSVFKFCERAYEQDSIIVASRKNMGATGAPAMYSNVISVDIQDFSDKYQFTFNPNSIIEFDARGTKLKLPAPGGGYTQLTGTSFATPHITGITALLLQAFPQMVPVEAKAVLKALSA